MKFRDKILFRDWKDFCNILFINYNYNYYGFRRQEKKEKKEKKREEIKPMVKCD